jgi:hypothetical protein
MAASRATIQPNHAKETDARPESDAALSEWEPGTIG